MEPQSDQRGGSSAFEHTADFPVAAVGDLYPRGRMQGFRAQRGDRMEPGYPGQGTATGAMGVRDTGATAIS